MTIETELAALTAQTLALDTTIEEELIDVNEDIIVLRARVTALETSGTGGTGGGGGEPGTVDGPTIIDVVTALPTTGEDGEVALFNGKLYFWNGTGWQEAVSTSEAPPAVEVVDSLPATADEGTVVFNTADGYLYRRVGGVWTQVVVSVTTGTEVADASVTVAKFAAGLRPVEVLGTLPVTGNVAGRLVFLTTDNKLYRYNGTAFVNGTETGDLVGTINTDQIAANSITTGKIQAGAINASQIAADAVNAVKIAAGSITSDKIVANAVTAEKIATNAITTDKLAANSITAGKIAAAAIGTTQLAAGAITADKIQAGIIGATQIAAGAISATKIAAGALTADKFAQGSGAFSAGLTFGLGGGATIGGVSSAGGFSSTSASYWGLIATSTGGNPAAGFGTTTSGQTAGGFFNSTSTAYTSHRTTATFAYGTVAGILQNNTSGKTLEVATASYAAYATGAYGPFTGSHDGLVPKEAQFTPGDILVDLSVAHKASVSDVLTNVGLSSEAYQKTVIGVYAQDCGDDHKPAALSEVISVPRTVVDEDGVEQTMVDQVTRIKPELEGVLSDRKVILMNSVGEGQVNVCGENGDIEAGDLIVSSSTPGKGMRQTSDAVRSFTVAKARESVTFSNPSEVKMIACTYLAG